MLTLLFASHNAHKAAEIRRLTPDGWAIKTLSEAGYDQPIPEPHDTLEANAEEKARVAAEWSGLPCFSEDTGLEVAALQGAPGVHTARYAGEGASDVDNMAKLLLALTGVEDRQARFRTVICLINKGNTYLFEGICEGVIVKKPAGNGGFGYDPLFQPLVHDRTLAQMTPDEKGKLSHRSVALQKLYIFLSARRDNVY